MQQLFLASLRAVLLGLLCSLLACGCYVIVLRPIAEPEDRILDTGLLGRWTNEQDTITIHGDTPHNLRFDLVEHPKPSENAVRHGSLELILTEIGGKKFLALKPTELDKKSLCVLEQLYLYPVYGVYRYRVEKDSLWLESLSSQELIRRAERKKLKRLPAELLGEGGPILITASTSKLRKYLAAHGDEAWLFEEPSGFVRVK